MAAQPTTWYRVAVNTQAGWLVIAGYANRKLAWAHRNGLAAKYPQRRFWVRMPNQAAVSQARAAYQATQPSKAVTQGPVAAMYSGAANRAAQYRGAC